eukprot:2445920-Amphidinium_carterae.1
MWARLDRPSVLNICEIAVEFAFLSPQDSGACALTFHEAKGMVSTGSHKQGTSCLDACKYHLHLKTRATPVFVCPFHLFTLSPIDCDLRTHVDWC